MRTISEKEYLKANKKNPSGIETWVFLFYKKGDLAGKFSCIGDYKDAKCGALRFMKLGGYEEGRVQ